MFFCSQQQAILVGVLHIFKNIQHCVFDEKFLVWSDRFKNGKHTQGNHYVKVYLKDGIVFTSSESS